MFTSIVTILQFIRKLALIASFAVLSMLTYAVVRHAAPCLLLKPKGVNKISSNFLSITFKEKKTGSKGSQYSTIIGTYHRDKISYNKRNRNRFFRCMHSYIRPQKKSEILPVKSPRFNVVDHLFWTILMDFKRIGFLFDNVNSVFFGNKGFIIAFQSYRK